MKTQFTYKRLLSASLLTLLVSASAQANAHGKKSSPEFNVMSALEFSPQGVLFIGDTNKGLITAIDLVERKVSSNVKPPAIADLKKQIAGLLGTKPSMVQIHDMAVNPVSKNTYLTVSRGKAKSKNVTAVLVRVKPDSSIEVVDLDGVKYSTAKVPNPVSKDKKYRNGRSKRLYAITQMSFKNDKLYVAGMSNEEFASSMWTYTYPFGDAADVTTVEVFHGAHGKYETHSPIRTFLPVDINNKNQLLAAYACTPLVTIDMDQIKDKAHVKGRTIAELGAGNGPIDIISYQYEGEQKILLSNSRQPLMSFNAKTIASYKGSMTKRASSYTEGVKFDTMKAKGVQELDNFNDDYVLTTTKMPNGQLALTSLSKAQL